MTLLNVYMLAGLSAALLPVVVHMLSRLRRRTMPWGAMMFLGDGFDGARRRGRLRQWLPLLARMGTIAALALALARPVLSGPWFGLPPRGPHVGVILFDQSGSMSAAPAGRSRMDSAREAALRVLAGYRPGDRVALISLGNPAVDDEAELTADLQSLATRIADAEAGDGRADIFTGLRRAAELLADAEPGPRHIYLICDRQAVNWNAMGDAGEWRRRVGIDDGRVRFIVIPVGGEETDNVAIESVTLIPPHVVADAPAELELRVRNHGADPVGPIPLTVGVVSTTLEIPPGQTRACHVPLRYRIPGSYLLPIAIRGGGPTFDDRLDLPLLIRRRPTTSSATTTISSLAAATAQQRLLLPGEPIVVDVDQSGPDLRATLELPDGTTETLEKNAAASGARFSYAKTHRTGRYLLRLRNGREQRLFHFVVRPLPEESDTHTLTEADWSRLGDAWGFTRLEADPTGALNLPRRLEHIELWPVLLGLSAALSALELAATRHGRGRP